jgi:hypothetical protein
MIGVIPKDSLTLNPLRITWGSPQGASRRKGEYTADIAQDIECGRQNTEERGHFRTQGRTGARKCACVGFHIGTRRVLLPDATHAMH